MASHFRRLLGSVSEDHLRFYATTQDGGGGPIYRIQKSGGGWTSVEVVNQAVFTSGSRMAVTPGYGIMIINYNSFRQYKDDDFSNLMTNMVPGGYSSFENIVSGGQYYFLARNSGVSWTTGYQTSIYRNSFTTPAATFSSWDQASNHSACSIDGQYVCIGGKQGFTNGFISRNYGATWSEALSTSSYGNGTNAVDMSNDGRYTIVATNSGYTISSDFLQTFNAVNIRSYRAAAVSGNGNVMYIASSINTGRSYDHGSTFNEVPILPIIPTSIATTYSGRYVVCCNGGSHVYISEDFGTTWRTILLSGITKVRSDKSRKT